MLKFQLGFLLIFCMHSSLSQALIVKLNNMADMERLIAKIDLSSKSKKQFTYSMKGQVVGVSEESPILPLNEFLEKRENAYNDSVDYVKRNSFGETKTFKEKSLSIKQSVRVGWKVTAQGGSPILNFLLTKSQPTTQLMINKLEGKNLREERIKKIPKHLNKYPLLTPTNQHEDSNILVFVTHAEQTFDIALSAKNGIDKNIRNIKENSNGTIIYLVNALHKNSGTNYFYTQERSPNYVITSQSGEHNISKYPRNVVIMGGFSGFCHRGTIQNVILFDHNPKPINLHFPLDSIYEYNPIFAYPTLDEEKKVNTSNSFLMRLIQLVDPASMGGNLFHQQEEELQRFLSEVLSGEIYLDGKLLFTLGTGKKIVRFKFWSKDHLEQEPLSEIINNSLDIEGDCLGNCSESLERYSILPSQVEIENLLKIFENSK